LPSTSTFRISLRGLDKLIPKIRESISKHKLASILVVGIIVRVILMPISAHPFDMDVWYAAALSVVKNGPLSIQSFPPVEGYILIIPIAYFYNWIVHTFSIGFLGPISMSSLPKALNFYPTFNLLYVPGFLFDTLVKLPLLLSDVFVTIVLYRVVIGLTNNRGLAEKAAIFWFLNPFLIWISAVWGMWDTLPALFSLLCLYFLLKKRFVYSAVCLSIGVFLKVYPALFLVPIAIFLYKTSSAECKLKNSLKFFSVFSIATLLLFVPYFSKIISVFSGILAPNPVTSGAVTNPVSNPVGFGLTYWSLYLLNRLINLPVTSAFVSSVSIASIILVIAALGLVYWKTTKLTFAKPVYDLGLALLLPVFALFLSFRIINEQWFVWALPFLVILSVGGRVKGVFYWGASAVSLLYVVLNCPLPFFFLPLAPWFTNALLSLANFILTYDSTRIVLLVASGCVFSVLSVLMLFQIAKTCRSENP